jgi:hypothetical protein
MKQLTKAGILAVSAALASQAAQAQFTANDLYLGFTQSSATSDYIIDLGQASSITGQSTVVDLTPDFSSSLFNTIFTGGATGVSMGVVGGNGTFGSIDLYTTIAGSTPSTDTSGYGSSSGSLATAADRISTMSPDLPTAGNGLMETKKDWANDIAPTFTAQTYYGASGINPNSAIDSSGVITESLWQSTPGNGYVYLGYFTLDTDTSLTFTSVNVVPEPTTVSFLIGGGLLLWMIRRRSARKILNNQ